MKAVFIGAIAAVCTVSVLTAGGFALQAAYDSGKADAPAPYVEISHSSEIVYLPEPEREGVDLITNEPDYAYEMATDDVAMIRDYGSAYVDEVRELWDLATKWYGTKHTNRQIADAVESIYQARQFYPELTHRQCLEYLVDEIPDTFLVMETTQSDTAIVGMHSQSSVDGNPAAATAVGASASEVKETSVLIKVRNVREVAAEKYATLETSYWEPIRQAQEAEAFQRQQETELIQQNAARARAKGAARNMSVHESKQAIAEAESDAAAKRRVWAAEQDAKWGVKR